MVNNHQKFWVILFVISIVAVYYLGKNSNNPIILKEPNGGEILTIDKETYKNPRIISSYTVLVHQNGGIGSKNVTLESYVINMNGVNTEETVEPLTPTEEYVNFVGFDLNATLIRVSCKDGYSISDIYSASSNKFNLIKNMNDQITTDPFIIFILENKIDNLLAFTCNKK
jgi:hypothetical protein